MLVDLSILSIHHGPGGVPLPSVLEELRVVVAREVRF
jgi:hypothetical protein